MLLALLVIASSASSGAAVKARAEYEAGAKAFRATDFDTALMHFERAYELDPSPVLIYNLARVHEEMGHAQDAIEHYGMYLDRLPDAADRADVERRIRVMFAILERQRPGATPPPTVEAQTSSSPSGRLSLYGYSALGLGVGGLAAGIGLGMAAADAEGAHADATTGAEKRSTADDADRFAGWANLSYLAGGVLLATGITLLVLDGGDEQVSVGPTPGGLVLGGRF